MKIKLRATTLALLCSMSLAMAQASATDRKVRVDIPAQSLKSAIKAYSEQTGVEVVYYADAVAGLRSKPVAAGQSADEALRLMLVGTGLEFERLEDGSVVLKRSTSVVKPGDEARLKPAARDQGSEVAQPEPVNLQTVVVTGSHLRGTHNSSSPVTVIDRAEIERSGHASVQEIVRALPQNFNSVSERIQENLMSVGGPTNAQSKYSAGADLRGLGPDSTLVLLNGRRIARAGMDTHADLTLIPLSAVERVEVLTDGASALYGSDAVGGVINVITRSNFNGAETRLRYGIARGSYSQGQASQLVGRSWGSGQLMAGIEYNRETPLYVHERFPDALFASRDTALIQASRRTGAIAYLEQDLSSAVRVDAEVTFGKRDTPASYGFDYGGYGGVTRVETQSWNVGIGTGLTVDLSDDWQLRANAGYDRNHGEYWGWYGPTMDSMVQDYDNAMVTAVRSLGGVADGRLFDLPGGGVLLAVGAEDRHERFDLDTHSIYWAPVTHRPQRRVRAAFAELNVPLIGEGNSVAAAKSLELSLAGRFERYSDFGNTFNPKIGLAWTPREGLTFRGSTGTSFKAPTLSQMIAQRSTQMYLGLFSDADGPTNILSVGGVAENLKPETSRNWSLGVDYQPAWISDLSLSATYYGITYRRRIGSPFPNGYNSFGSIMDPNYGFVVTPNPDLDEVRGYLGSEFDSCWEMQGSDFLPCDSSANAGSVNYIVDERTRNLAGVRQRLFDFSAQYSHDSRVGQWHFALSGTRMLSSTKTFVPGASPVGQLDQVFYPADLRLRGSAALAGDGWSSQATIHYTDGYRDTYYRPSVSPDRPSRVGSFTVLDLSFQYDLRRLLSLQQLDGVQLQLSATNVFDRKPPFVENYYHIDYDPTNADAVGRVVSAQLKVDW
ncbi:MAG: TonB-dependent receptor [Rhodanobacter sp.]